MLLVLRKEKDRPYGPDGREKNAEIQIPDEQDQAAPQKEKQASERAAKGFEGGEGRSAEKELRCSGRGGVRVACMSACKG